MNPSADATIDPLDRLISELNDSDVRVAQAALKRYEPFLRMVIRRHLGTGLRSKFDSVDLVQSIWADVLGAAAKDDWRFRDAPQLRAFLARAARNRVIDKRRKHRHAIGHEGPIEAIPPGEQPRQVGPRASEVVRGRELWERLLEACPSSHREILRLRLEGRTIAEIAERRGLHEGSVRRILYGLARTLPVSEMQGTPPS
jgi:RNA polymerase sigma factor (sigma-70 family)